VNKDTAIHLNKKSTIQHEISSETKNGGKTWFWVAGALRASFRLTSAAIRIDGV
jgi:hypothetical protein